MCATGGSRRLQRGEGGDHTPEEVVDAAQLSGAEQMLIDLSEKVDVAVSFEGRLSMETIEENNAASKDAQTTMTSLINATGAFRSTIRAATMSALGLTLPKEKARRARKARRKASEMMRRRFKLIQQCLTT